MKLEELQGISLVNIYEGDAWMNPFSFIKASPTLSRSYHRGSKEWKSVSEEIAWGISCEAKFVRNGDTLDIILYAAA